MSKFTKPQQADEFYE
jgi:nucleoside-diphosphate kinase